MPEVWLNSHCLVKKKRRRATKRVADEACRCAVTKRECITKVGPRPRRRKLKQCVAPQALLSQTHFII